MKKIDLTGRRFGRWIVISESPIRTSTGHIVYNCICDCGTGSEIPGGNLQSGKSSSCGCLKIEMQTKHGYAVRGFSDQTYNCWSAMKDRCFNPKCEAFKNYGARGITVCDSWLYFENFLADMGRAPIGYTIERDDNNGNYEPDNCRWATRKEQAQNRRPRS